MTPPGAGGRDAYRRSGVDLDAGARAVRLITDLADRATRPEVQGELGGFAGLYEISPGRYLVAATDGVGTKLEVARQVGRYDTVGIDLVAMCANDVVCTGAEPLFFLDYLAVGELLPERVAAVVAGVAEGCRRAGCALLGGETAEHPGTMEPDQLDLAGFCVGAVDREAMLDAGNVRPGDVLLGLPSTGLHSNGFSLVRRAFAERALDLPLPGLGRSLGEELLEPTAVYVRAVRALAAEGLARSAAHITGGGFGENVPRALPPGLGAEIDTTTWEPPPIFGMVAEAVGVPPAELFDVLNMGIGMLVAVPQQEADRSADIARAAGMEGVVIGRVTEEPGVLLT